MMVYAVIVIISVSVGLFIEALIFAPEKMPWNRRRKK